MGPEPGGVHAPALGPEVAETYTGAATRIDEESAPVAPDDHAIQGLVISASSPTIVLVKALFIETAGDLGDFFRFDHGALADCFESLIRLMPQKARAKTQLD